MQVHPALNFLGVSKSERKYLNQKRGGAGAQEERNCLSMLQVWQDPTVRQLKRGRYLSGSRMY